MTGSQQMFVGVLLALYTSGVDAQGDQDSIARQLLQENRVERSHALDMAAAIEPRDVGPGLRAALIALLESKNRIVAETSARREPLSRVEDPEFVTQLQRLVARLREPAAIPALAGALGWFTVVHSLADFGEQAVPAVLAVVMSPDSAHDAVNDGLMTLRFMVEQRDVHPLGAASLAQIRSAAEKHLTTGKGLQLTTLWQAIDLAAVLQDTGLRKVIEALAVDANEVVARGIEDPERIGRTQQRAAERLAGIPPLPRP
jgi:hypothetical protein